MTRLERILEGFRMLRKPFTGVVARNSRMSIIGILALVLAVSFSAAAFFGGSGNVGTTVTGTEDIAPEAPVSSSDTSAVGNQVLVFADDKDVFVGSTFNAEVTVTDTTNLNILSYQFDIFYNPAVIFPVGGLNCLSNNQCWGTAGTIDPNFGCAVNSGTAGLLKVACFASSPMSGSGVLINLKFNAIGAIGTFSNLTWQTDLLRRISSLSSIHQMVFPPAMFLTDRSGS